MYFETKISDSDVLLDKEMLKNKNNTNLVVTGRFYVTIFRYDVALKMIVVLER